MFSKTLKSKVVFALLIAMFMAWAGHASALLAPAGQMPALEHGHAQLHDDVEVAASCLSCADHFHTQSTPDHVHETPNVHAPQVPPTLPERGKPLELQATDAPPGPIFLIERPPRIRLVF